MSVGVGPSSTRTAPVRAGLPLRVWVAWVTAGELLGFTAPLAAGVAVGTARPSVAVPVLVGAGVVEGAVLGSAQAHVLRRALPRLRGRRWVALTAAGAAVAWVLGLTPSSAEPWWRSWPAAAVGVAAVVLAVLLLSCLGVAQWVELRRHLPGAGWWVAVTAVGWGAGLAAFGAVTAPLWQPGQGALVVAAVGVLGAAVMASTMAAVTGWWLVRRLGAASAGEADDVGEHGAVVPEPHG